MSFIEEIKQFSDEYLDLMDLCHDKIKTFPSPIHPNYINLSTMTMICDLTTSIDILSFSDNFKKPDDIECYIKRPKQSKEFELSKRGKKKKTFFNQASIHYTTHTTKCIKVFSNGRLHITGVTSMIEASDVCSFTCNILNKTIGAVIGDNSVEAINLKICMINTNFGLNHGIDIIKLKNIIRGAPDITCSYTPDTYPGLKIKYFHLNKNKSSIFIFSSGQIVITGVKLLSDVIEVYKCLMDIITHNFDDIHNPNIILRSKKKQTETYSFGYKNSTPLML
jgi:TATA-box binding protein (TBP) (component of TFIID and TFIIIB)